MRGTIHLLSADDALGLRAPVPAGARPGDGPPLPAQGGPRRRRPRHRSARSRGSCSTSRCSVPRLRGRSGRALPEHDPAALAFACRNTVPLVQAPPRGLWTRTGAVTYVAAEHWLGAAGATVDDRRPRAPLPAGVRSGHRRRLRDLDPPHPPPRGLRPARVRSCAPGPTSAVASCSTSPTAEITDEDVPAPVRFLPEYDNVLLSHADRSRITGGLPPDAVPARRARASATSSSTAGCRPRGDATRRPGAPAPGRRRRPHAGLAEATDQRSRPKPSGRCPFLAHGAGGVQWPWSSAAT